MRRAGGLRMCESPGTVPHTGTRWALSGCERPFRAGFSDGPAELVGGHKVRPAATEPKPPLAGGRNFSAQSGVEGWRRLLGCCSDMPLPPGRSRRTVSAALERYRLPQAAWSAAEARALRAGGQWAWREGSGHGGRAVGMAGGERAQVRFAELATRAHCMARVRCMLHRTVCRGCRGAVVSSAPVGGVRHRAYDGWRFTKGGSEAEKQRREGGSLARSTEGLRARGRECMGLRGTEKGVCEGVWEG